MNIAEIREKYLQKIENQRSYCCEKIDRHLIWQYRDIISNRTIEINRYQIDPEDNNFEGTYGEDIIKAIKQHYAKDWDVIYMPEDKKNRPYFIFTYKGDLTEKIPEPKAAVEEIAKQQEETNRYEIMNFEE